MKIQGIAQSIVDRLVNRSNELGQGRGVGAIGVIDDEGYITACSEGVDGGISGIPYRQLLDQFVDFKGQSMLEGINQLPDNVVLINTSPGSTGLIASTGAINMFEVPMIRVGIKGNELAGVGVIYPQEELFDLATRSEQVKIEILGAKDMNEERELARASAELKLKYLDICDELQLVDKEETDFSIETKDYEIEHFEVNSIDKDFVDALVAQSSTIEQGREVAAMGHIDENGRVVQKGEVVIGGMGYVPGRMLASSYTDISGKSLRRVYTEDIPDNAIVVHTHPGGTGVMHMGDAMAGPGTWGRSIIAIGHDQDEIKGATVIEPEHAVTELADEYEEVGQKFYLANTPEEETIIRKKRFQIVQQYTDLCKPIEIN